MNSGKNHKIAVYHGSKFSFNFAREPKDLINNCSALVMKSILFHSMCVLNILPT